MDFFNHVNNPASSLRNYFTMWRPILLQMLVIVSAIMPFFVLTTQMDMLRFLVLLKLDTDVWVMPHNQDSQN